MNDIKIFEQLGLVLDHIAIACDDLEETVKLYEMLGFRFSPKRELVAEQFVKTAFASCDDHAHLELLTPSEDQGPIADYLKKKGPGLHHLCFRVQDIHAMMERLQNEGYRFIYPRPVQGANACLVNFLHPKSGRGVLIELSQHMSHGT